MKAVLIDDEKNNLDNLVNIVGRYCPGVEIVALAGNAEEGRAAILRERPELVLLDIQMPGQNGFELLQTLGVYDFEVIFITAWDQYAIQAVRFSAVDYLLKPVNIDDLQAAVARAEARSRSKRQNMQLENLLQLLRQQKEEHRIALTGLKETRFVPTGEIIRCESSNNYSTFYLRDGEKLVVSRPIYEYEELLQSYGFIRCHQSHLVNCRAVRSWVREDGGYLVLDNGDQVPVSRGKKDAVAAALRL